MKSKTRPHNSTRSGSLFRRAGITLLAVAAFLAAGGLADAQHFNVTSNWSIGVGTANLKNDGNTRGLAYNAVSNQVYLAYRGSPASIYVLDGTAGTVLGSIASSTISAYSIGVADDGVLYAVPLANGVGANNLNIYAFTNWLSAQRQCYAQVSGDATSSSLVQGQRIGDTMTVGGAGTNTLLLLPINATTTTHSSTNFLLYSTIDGQAFTPTIISVAGLPTPGSDAAPRHPVAFYTNNTFLYRPALGSSVYLIQYPANFASLTSPVTGTVIATNTTLPSSSSGSDTYVFSYSPAGKILADYGQVLNASGATSLGIYDISSFPTANSLATTNTVHTNSNGNYTADVALGGVGKTNEVYVLDANNGVFAFGLSFVAAPVAPTISSSPTGGNVYTNLGSFTFSVSAAGTVPLTYYWQSNSVSNQLTATTFLVTTNSSYTISNLTVASSGWYDVIVSNVAGVTNTLPVDLIVSAPLASAYVSNLFSLAADNSQPYLDTGYNTRGLAFDLTTLSLLLAEHSGDNIYVLNATNGTFEYTLTTESTGLPEGSLFNIGQVGVADDGAVYVCNVSSYNPSSDTAVPGTSDFSITRFDVVTNPTNSNYNLEAAFTGDPGAYSPTNMGVSSQDRWGDSMAVRGAGTNTQILLGTYETISANGVNEYGTGPGTNVAILTTQDGIHFTPTTIAVTNAPDGFSYLGVAWGISNTFWAKSPGYDLRQVQYNLTTGIGTVIQDFSTTAGSGSLSSLCGIGLDVSNNILAGVNISDTPNDLELFQIPTAGHPPQSYYQAFFAAYNANINGNAATTVKYPYIFSLDANNGIIGLTYSVPLLPFYIAETNTPSGIVLTWPTVIGHTYQLQYATVLTGSTNAWTNIGSPITATSSSTLSYTNSSVTGAKYYQVIAH